MAQFDKEHSFFLKHQDELVSKYANMFLVIRGNSLIGAYGNVGEADRAAQEKFKPGTYMIRQALPGDEAYTVRLGAMGVFACD